MEKKDIDRINELARKSKTVGLTLAEVRALSRIKPAACDADAPRRCSGWHDSCLIM